MFTVSVTINSNILVVFIVTLIYRKMDVLRQRIQESDNVELKLLRAERKIKQLEQQIQEGEDNQRLVTISKKQLLEYQSLVDSKRQLEEENNVLR